MVHFKNYQCEPVFTEYENGRIAIMLRDTVSGEPIAKSTTNIPEVTIPDGCAFIKDWAENEGMLEALIEAGVVDPPVHIHPIGWIKAYLCKVNLSGKENV